MMYSMERSRGPSERRERKAAAGSMAPQSPGGFGESQERDGSAGGTASRIAGPSNNARSEQKEEKDKTAVNQEDYDSAEEVFDLDTLLNVDLDKELEPDIMKAPPVELSILKGNNYDIWAQEHRIHLEWRGIFGIVNGTIPMPRTVAPARRWVKLDRWITTIIFGHVDDIQKSHIARLKTSKAQWDVLERIHGASGKARIPAIRR